MIWISSCAGDCFNFNLSIIKPLIILFFQKHILISFSTYIEINSIVIKML